MNESNLKNRIVVFTFIFNTMKENDIYFYIYKYNFIKNFAVI